MRGIRKHITGAIFRRPAPRYPDRTVSWRDRFARGSDCYQCSGRHLHECLEYDDLPTGILFRSLWVSASIGSAKTTGKIHRCGHGVLPVHNCTRQPCRSDHSETDLSLEKAFASKMATSDIAGYQRWSSISWIRSRDLIPSNPVSAFAEGNMLQVLVFAADHGIHTDR